MKTEERGLICLIFQLWMLESSWERCLCSPPTGSARSTCRPTRPPQFPGTGRQEPSLAQKHPHIRAERLKSQSLMWHRDRPGPASSHRSHLLPLGFLQSSWPSGWPQETTLKQIGCWFPMLPRLWRVCEGFREDCHCYSLQTCSVRFWVAAATVNRWLMSHKLPKEIQQHAQGDWEEGNHTSGLDQSWLLRKKEGVTLDWGPTH